MCDDERGDENRLPYHAPKPVKPMGTANPAPSARQNPAHGALDDEDALEPYELCYRDGSPQNECWHSKA